MTHLPEVTSTPAERLQALKDAKELLTGKPETISGGLFSSMSTKPVYPPSPGELFRVAEYITTGHDYADTHPKGKRRPKRIINVTVVAPPAADDADLAHFFDHLKDGSFAEFVEDALNDIGKPKVEDEPEHRPVDPEDRPRYNL